MRGSTDALAPRGPAGFSGRLTSDELAESCGIRPTKQRGQNFVTDANTVRRIVRTSGVGADDVVVEIGPGLGSLTLGLLEVASHVTAVEIDEVLAAQLPSTIAEYAPDQAAHFDLVTADAMKVTELPGPAPTALVANLPYNVSVPVLLTFFERFPSITTGLVMVQAEVAHRLAAGPGSKTYGVPSVKAAWYAELRLAGSVGRNVFWPMPNVESSLVAWTRREPPATRRIACVRSRSSTPRSPSAARPCAPRCRSSPARAGRRGGPRRGRHLAAGPRRTARRRGVLPPRPVPDSA